MIPLERRLRFLWEILAGPSGYFAVQNRENGSSGTWWLDVGDPHLFVNTIAAWAPERELHAGACPYLDRGSYRLHDRPSALWVRTETGRSRALLSRFQPAPTLILSEGGTVRQIALWALRKPLTPEDAERANKRLAHRLGTPKKYAAMNFTLPTPGTFLREGRKRPVPIVVAGGTGELYGAGAVVKRLADAPDPREAFERFRERSGWK